MKALSPLFLSLAMLAFAAPLRAQVAPTVAPAPPEDDEPVRVGEGVTSRISIAVPTMPTPSAANTAAGNTEALGRQVAEIVAGDRLGRRWSWCRRGSARGEDVS